MSNGGSVEVKSNFLNRSTFFFGGSDSRSLSIDFNNNDDNNSKHRQQQPHSGIGNRTAVKKEEMKRVMK